MFLDHFCEKLNHFITHIVAYFLAYFLKNFVGLFLNHFSINSCFSEKNWENFSSLPDHFCKYAFWTCGLKKTSNKKEFYQDQFITKSENSSFLVFVLRKKMSQLWVFPGFDSFLSVSWQATPWIFTTFGLVIFLEIRKESAHLRKKS